MRELRQLQGRVSARGNNSRDPFQIDPDACIDCGACEAACPSSAIIPVPDNRNPCRNIPSDRNTRTSAFCRRARHRSTAGSSAPPIACGKHSTAGSVSQRACVFCGSRVVLYPISDALHLVHGPIGCAAYTWDIRGALSSGPQLHRNSFSTDLQELNVIYGGEKKLYAALIELIDRYQPRAAFIYSTCIVGLIGDDVDAVARRVSAEKGIPVLPVNSEGFRGTKKDGYRAACEAVYTLVGTGDTSGVSPHSINILGEFNLAGEAWIIRDYYQRMGIQVVSCITGDARVDDIRRCHGAKLNLVQCSGSMTHLAKVMERDHGIPMKRVSYFGIEDMSAALYEAAKFFSDDPTIMERAEKLVARGGRRDLSATPRIPEKTRREKSGDLRRWCVQGILACARAQDARHGDSRRRLADR